MPSREVAIDPGRGRPIFILGCPRSGTTLLGLMLHRHPKIAIPQENRFVMPVYFERDEFGDLALAENRRLLAEKIVTSESFDDLGLDRAEMEARIVASCWTIGSAVGVVLRSYADRFGKVRWGDKRPAYRNCMWAIQRMFPDVQFVHIVRDGRDCVASMRWVPPWDEVSLYPRVRAWVEAIDQGKRAQQEFPPDTFYELRYEQLVTDPEKQLRGLCDFLGESFDASMLHPEELANAVVPEDKTWHVRTRQGVSTDSIGRFHERLEPWELQVCEAIMGDRLREHGYELTGAAPPEGEQLETYRAADRRKRRALRRRRRTDRALDYPWPVADMSASEAEQRRRVADLEKQVGELREQVSSITRERDSLRSRLDRVLGSRTWRWTEPVRKTVRRVAGHRDRR